MLYNICRPIYYVPCRDSIIVLDMYFHLIDKRRLKKGIVCSKTGCEIPEREQKFNSTLSVTSAVDGGGWLTPRPGRSVPGKETRYPLYRRLRGYGCRSGRVRKILPPPEFDPRTVQPVASFIS
jgi:hypothetical protein